MIRAIDSETGRHDAPDDTAHAPPQIAPATTAASPDGEAASKDTTGGCEKEKRQGQKRNAAQIFAVCAHRVSDVLRLGPKETLAFLTVARGTGGDNRTSSWGAESIQRYGLMGLPSACTALKKLEAAQLISPRGQNGKRNQRRIAEPVLASSGGGEKAKPNLIWLPNRLIGDKPGDQSGLGRLREMEPSVGAPALALLLEIYRLYHPVFHSGVDPTQLSVRAGLRFLNEERGTERLYGVVKNSYRWRLRLPSSPLPLPPPKEIPRLLNTLVELHLIRGVEYIFDRAPEYGGEPLFPFCQGAGDEAENAEGARRRVAAEQIREASLKNERHAFDGWDEAHDEFAAVPRHVTVPQLVGLVRPRWLADTSHNRRFLARVRARWQHPEAEAEA